MRPTAQPAGPGANHPMTVPERAIGLSFYFEVPARANPQAVEMLVADSLPVIRRFLDDPVNVNAIGQKPDPARNAFLAMLLAVDRAGFEPGTLSVLPAEPACSPAAHAPGAGGRCQLCAAMRVVAVAQREKLILIRKVAGDKDAKGHYVNATDIAIAPGQALDDYRDRIKRLSLPLLMAAPDAPGESGPEPEPGEARRQLASLRVGSWAELSFDVHALGFTVSGITGNRADLSLTRDLWAFFGDLAKSSGLLRPKLLAGRDPRIAKLVAALRATLKRSFPQVPGDPIESQAGGAYKAAFAIKSGEMPESGSRWG
jgi:hypothetical protein